MPNREPIETTNLDTIYASQTIPWSRPRDLVAVGAFGPGTACFLGTVRPSAARTRPSSLPSRPSITQNSDPIGSECRTDPPTPDKPRA
jgi:hypothetical protein